MTELRAITIRQPWAEAVVDGFKPIENRSQGFAKGYRGLVLIHAGKGWSSRGEHDPRVLAVYPRPPRRESVDAGAVLGVADLVDVHPASQCCAPWGEETYPPANPEGRPPGRVTHLVLEHPVRIHPVPARGALGLWRPDEDLVLEVAAHLARRVTWDGAGARRVAARGDVAQLWHLLSAA